MNKELFFSTFLLIFVAELGDKTQLAAMARSAAGDKWTVFFAASAALVCSTLVAVLFGSTLTKFIPEIYIKVAAGILFIGFGILIIYSEFSPATTAEVPAKENGILADVVFVAAAHFESAAIENYRQLADSCSDKELREVLLGIAAEEQEHLARVHSGLKAHKGETIAPETDIAVPTVADVDRTGSTNEVLRRAIDHEEATAVFYAEMSRNSVIPDVKRVFQQLAQEEQVHLRRLQSFLPQKEA